MPIRHPDPNHLHAYRVSAYDLEITRVPVLDWRGSSPRFRSVQDGLRDKRSTHAVYFETFSEAQAHRVACAKENVETAKRELTLMQARHAEAEADLLLSEADYLSRCPW